MSTTSGQSASPASSASQNLLRGAGIIIVSSVMFTFIGYWRTAAVVLCDLASTSFYIGALVELSVGPAAPWFILAVMCFSYAVRWVYIESCTMFVRGGVYRVVREAMGSWMAKLAVSALMFDYILTGPISSVSAGQYIIGLGLDALEVFGHVHIPVTTGKWLKNWGSVLIAIAVTIYFYRQNIRGIHESSDKALKIMIITTIMGVIMIGWCALTLLVQGPKNPFPSPIPELTPRINHSMPHKEGELPPPEDPLGFIQNTQLADQLRGQPDLDADGKQKTGVDGNPRYVHSEGTTWFGIIGLLGIAIAFGHSILAMSGEETLAQVYREVESPKLPNFKKAALIVFLYSLGLTATISFFAVLLIPDATRMSEYGDNLIGGLAMNVLGPPEAQFALRALVVVVGFLILSGAVNTAIIGSNGVLNRVAEDGVMPDWFLKPHEKYGTTYRVLTMIVILQLLTILFSGGDVFLLGEAYAFGVVWSFVFQAASMMVLRFTKKEPREFKVPLNVTIKGVEIPVGLGLILLILVISAIMNFLTKEYATIGGVFFTTAFFMMFTLSERYNLRRLHGQKHEHLEQFNQEKAGEINVQSLGLTRPYRKLVSIRSPQNLYMLEKALQETDPQTTDVVVMTAKFIPPGAGGGHASLDTPGLDEYDQQLMTAVVNLAEKAGKEIKPLIVPTNNPLHAILKMAKDIQAQELILGASNKYTADMQSEQLGFYWVNLHEGNPSALTVRIINRERDMYLDLAGGNRIPTISERQAKSVDDLRAAQQGVERVLLMHDGKTSSSDLFHCLLTLIDDKIAIGVVSVALDANGANALAQDQERAKKLGRNVRIHELTTRDGPEIVDLARKERYNLVILPLPSSSARDPLGTLEPRDAHIVRHAHCRVMLTSTPVIPDEVVDRS